MPRICQVGSHPGCTTNGLVYQCQEPFVTAVCLHLRAERGDIGRCILSDLARSRHEVGARHVVALVLIDDREIARGRAHVPVLCYPKRRRDKLPRLHGRTRGLEKCRRVAVGKLPEDGPIAPVDALPLPEAAM